MENRRVGLTSEQVSALRQKFGKNEVGIRTVGPLSVLLRQLNNPILLLLVVALSISGLLGEIVNATLIGTIVALSIGLGFFTEYRAERATADLHARVQRHAAVIRDGFVQSIPASELVPGDIVKLRIGSVVPADLRLIEVDGLECDESIITGESLPVTKVVAAESSPGTSATALMGTVVRIGTATAEVMAIGGATELGRIAATLGRREPETRFQSGTKEFSVFLLRIAVLLGGVVVVGNLLLGRPGIDALLFALAMAVGMTPQLLPAIVSTALAGGSRRLAKEGVLVKRLVSIEDLGDVDILLVDKTGTLTSGEIVFDASYPVGPANPVVSGLLAIESEYSEILRSTAGLSQLDAALWSARRTDFPSDAVHLDAVPFDHNRRMVSALVRLAASTRIIVKGSPEEVLARCREVGTSERSLLQSLYAQGARVIAVAEKELPNREHIGRSDESNLQLAGFLTFTDPPKREVRASLDELKRLGIEVKVATGDSLEVTEHVCASVGLEAKGALSGAVISTLTDEELASRAANTTIFARVSPEEKARVLAALRARGESVAFLGDGVNDAIALHDADVGISVESAVDVAKDAADVVLTRKDLSVLSEAIIQGRLVFSNTMKYIYMSTSADFGNFLSASIGSLVLPFLPMLPIQVLLQDLLYDASQLAIPRDRVDREQIVRPSHWSIREIRRFMLIFGLASSIFDFATYGLLLFVLRAKEAEFHTGWFIESLATATLVVLAIRTRRVPFFKSTPSRILLVTLVAVNAIAIGLTLSPLAADLGLVALPIEFYAALAAMILLYILFVEVAKRRFLGRVLQAKATASPTSP